MVTVNLRRPPPYTEQDIANALFERTGHGQDRDAFNRLRVSSPTNLWTSEFQYNKHPLYFDEVLATNGTATHLPNESAVALAVTAEDGSKAQLTTFAYHRYQPGKSQGIDMTFVADAMENTTCKFVRRTKTSGSVVDNKISQAEWNQDAFDGKGQSGSILNKTKGQILHIDLSWLSMGIIRYGWEVAGIPRYAHYEFTANEDVVGSMTTANLPVRWEIVTDATFTTMRIGYFDDDNGAFVEFQGTKAVKTLTAICSTVYSEGGIDEELGHTFAGGNGAILRTGIGTTKVPICSFRPATTINSITNRFNWALSDLEVFGNDAMCWELIYAPTSITGATFAVGAALHSGTEVDIAGTAISGGIVIAGGYVAANNKGGIIGKNIRTKFPFALDSAGADQSRSISVVVTTLGGTNKSAAATLNFVEVR